MEHIFAEHILRKTVSLNGEWQFCVDKENVGENDKWYINFPEKSGYINVPSCWNNELGLYHYVGKAWYKKEFVTAECYLQLTFGAVTGEATVYLDGEFLGKHYGGWLMFSLGKFVKSGSHTVVVCVDNTPNDFDTFPLKETDWTHFGGITRSVEFAEFYKPFIKNVKIGYTLNKDMDSAVLQPTVYIENPFGTEYSTTVSFYLNDELLLENLLVVNESGEYKLPQITAANIKLWNFNEGNLYDVRIALLDDDICEKIGFRKIEVKGDEVFLNGKPAFLKGVNRHELHPDWSFAVPQNISKRDVSICKDLNCNFVRIAHYPHTHNFLDYLDREGITAWLEIPMWQFNEKSLGNETVWLRAKQMYTEMVEQYYNHPCIIIWGLHNEVQTDTEAGYEFTKKAYNYVKQMDKDRLISFASDRFARDISFEFADIVALNNYFGWYYGKESDWQDYIKGWHSSLEERGFVNKPVMLSEFGVPALYGNSSLDKEKWSMEYQADYLENVINLCANTHGVCGTAIWHLFDFPSDKDIAKSRSYNNKGILNEYRRPKLAYYKVKELYKNIK